MSVASRRHVPDLECRAGEGGCYRSGDYNGETGDEAGDQSLSEVSLYLPSSESYMFWKEMF